MNQSKKYQKGIAAQEREAHDKLYSNVASEILENPLTWEHYRATRCIPPHQGGPLYGLDCQIFLDRIEKALEGSKGGRVLDYGCGLGEMGILAAQRGFQVDGFDISPEAVRGATQWARKSGVKENVDFTVANAESLPYDNNTFDIVIGKAVLHHVIKYDNTGGELYRIMKTGSKGFFLEGAANNPLIRLARIFTIKDELGDVPLDVSNINKWGAKFDNINIDGYFLLYMLKRLGYESYGDELEGRGRNRFGNTKLYQKILSFLLSLDSFFVNNKWYSKYIAGRYLIEVEK